MEHKAHSRRQYNPADRASRTRRDLSNCSLKSDSSTSTKNSAMIGRRLPHVCVVGGGMAGLRCTEVLLEQNIKVTLLEGRRRIGGRIHQSNHLGHSADMGPNWIHGTDHNPILDLARETGTAASSTGERTCVFDEVGKLMDMKKASDLSEMVWGIIADAFKHSNENPSTIQSNESLKDFFILKVGEKEVSEVEKKEMLQMAEMWGAIVGDPLEKQSLKYFWMEECIDGENLFVASTYKDILKRVAKAAINNADLHLGTKVESIKAKSTPNGEPRVLVRTNVADFECDEVVVTVPLGCLKRNSPQFSPPLTPRIARAIANLSYGHLEKVYITFPTAFWDSPSNLGLETNNETFPFFSHFLSPTYSPKNPQRWNIEIVSLSSTVLPKDHRHPTLLFYIQGPCSAYITSGIQEHTSEQDHFRFLDEFFKPYYSRLPHYTSAKACQPLAILATDWSNDPLAGNGAYTNFQICEPVAEREEEVRLDEDVEALRYGMPERGIWLAGEHTAPFIALGTVTGAYWSGEGVARRLLAAYGFEGEIVQNRHPEVVNGVHEGKTQGSNKAATTGVNDEAPTKSYMIKPNPSI